MKKWAKLQFLLIPIRDWNKDLNAILRGLGYCNFS